MTIFRRAPAGLVGSGVFVLGLFYAAKENVSRMSSAPAHVLAPSPG